MKKVLIILAVIVVVALAIFFVKGRGEQGFGGVATGHEYKYRQFTGSIATSTEIIGSPTVLGSVIITEDSATAVTFYDATSTAAVTEGTYATKIAVMEATLAEGTYVFDVQTTRGLVMQSTDGFTFAGDWTVTYR